MIVTIHLTHTEAGNEREWVLVGLAFIGFTRSKLS